MSKRTKTPTFLLELPLQVDAQQAKHLRAHFEAARCLYNALLGEAMKRLKQLRADPRWQKARRAVDKQQRNALFSQLRQEDGLSEYALHAYATEARTTWIAEHIDSNTAQQLATRAYQAVNRVCFGQARSVRSGNTIMTEKLSYKAWQKQYGKSVGAHAPGMFIERLKRTVARTGGILQEVPTRSTKLSQYCHGCGTYVKKPLSERWHQCECGIGPVQRDLYSAFLVAHLDPRTFVPSIAQSTWESAETRLRAAIEEVQQRANAGEALPQSMGVPRARARLPRNLASDHQGLCLPIEDVEAMARWQEPPVF